MDFIVKLCTCVMSIHTFLVSKILSNVLGIMIVYWHSSFLTIYYFDKGMLCMPKKCKRMS